MKTAFLAILAGLTLAWQALAAPAGPVRIGFDGEYGLPTSTSAQAIERGIRIAIAEINTEGGVLGGRPLELTVTDNRSIPARGVANLERLAELPDLVAVMGGRFSMVIMEQIPTAHRLEVPLLDAWASATGITHHGLQPDYSFRLSLSDEMLIPLLLDQTMKKADGRTVVLLVPNTAWGRSSEAAAQIAARARGIELSHVVWYNFGEQEMLPIYRKALSCGAGALLLVANEPEGGRLIRAMGALREHERVPIVAHWGVTGGQLAETAGPALGTTDLQVAQSFSFLTAVGPRLEGVLRRLRDDYGITEPRRIESPVGLAQAYDLTRILARAVDLAGSTDRRAVRDALEQVRDYRGLSGDYPRPFEPGRHDAMRPAQAFMARIEADGAIVPLKVPESRQ